MADIYIVDIVKEGPLSLDIPTYRAHSHRASRRKDVTIPEDGCEGECGPRSKAGLVRVYGKISYPLDGELGSFYNFAYGDTSFLLYLQDDDRLVCIRETPGCSPGRCVADIIDQDFLGDFSPERNYCVDLLVHEDCSCSLRLHDQSKLA